MTNWYEWFGLDTPDAPHISCDQAKLAQRTARQLERDLLSGCGVNSCRFKRTSGMGTNGGCRCREGIQDALEAFARRVSAGRE